MAILEGTPYDQLAPATNWENAYALPGRSMVSRAVDAVDFMFRNKAFQQFDGAVTIASDLKPWQLRGRVVPDGAELPTTQPGDFLSVVLDEVIVYPQEAAPDKVPEQTAEEFLDASRRVADYPWYLATTPAELQTATRSGSVTVLRRSALLLGSTVTGSAFMTGQLVREIGEKGKIMDVYMEYGSFVLPRMVVGRPYLEDGAHNAKHARITKAEHFTVPLPVEVG